MAAGQGCSHHNGGTLKKDARGGVLSEGKECIAKNERRTSLYRYKRKEPPI